jgi:uncharacterized membrane protein YkvA (DUF1232 family)
MEVWMIYVLLVVGVGIVASMALLYAVSRFLEKREPYKSFLRLSTLQKVRFFRSLVSSSGLPRRVKVLPLILAIYLVSPVDLIPDFVPVLGYVDDVGIILATLALIIRWTPNELIIKLLERTQESD